MGLKGPLVIVKTKEPPPPGGRLFRVSLGLLLASETETTQKFPEVPLRFGFIRWPTLGARLGE
jgi:hypothetical protein